MNVVKRQLEAEILKRLKYHNKVILLFGARRVGKTVLIKQIIKQFEGKNLLLNGEDDDTLALLEERSIKNYQLLLQDVNLLVIDEAQNIPDIGRKLKLIIDEIKEIKVIASGSSSFDLLNKAGEPLVGRNYQYRLYPFSQQEISEEENLLDTRKNLEMRLLYGSYPETVGMENLNDKKEYLRNMVDAYLLKDILSMEGLRNAAKMKNLLKLVAYQTGKEVAYDELGKSLGLSKNTVEKYLDILSKVFVVYRLGAFAKNLRKEIVKTGKWFFYDNGIRNAVIGNFSPLSVRQDTGQLWESYLISERIKQNAYQGLNKNFYFWRTYDGQEIDLIEEQENTIQAFEFKYGDKKTKIPVAFANAYPGTNFTIISRENYLPFIMDFNKNH